MKHLTSEFQGLLRRILHWGVPAQMRPEQAKYIRFCNAIAIFLFFFVPLNGPVDLDLGLQPLVLASFVYAAFMALCVWLNYLHRYTASRHVLSLVSIAYLIVVAQQTGPRSGTQYFLFTVPVVAQYLYPPQERVWTWVYSILPALAFFGVYFTHGLGFGGPVMPPLTARITYLWTVFGIFLALIALSRHARVSTQEAEAQLEVERGTSEALLLNILPRPIADRLRAQAGTIADGYADVTVLLADIVGFTRLSAGMAPERVVDMLNTVFTAFDGLATARGLEKIKTIGDAYMLAGGLPDPRADHAEAVADMALAMLEAVSTVRLQSGAPLDIRVGIHTGPVVAGVIGKTKYIYDLWGDTVNTASRMESHGVPGAIQVSAATRQALGDRFVFNERGEIDIKGKGMMRVYLLQGRANAPPPRIGPAPRTEPA